MKIRPQAPLLVAGALLALSVLAGPLAATAQDTGLPADSMQLNVKDMPVQEVLRLIAERGQLNLAIGTGVSGNLTLYVQELPIESMLRLVVDMVGAALAEEDGVYRVMTVEAYERAYGEIYRDLRQTAWFTLKNVPVQQVAASLAALRSRDGQVVPDAQGNSLLIVETPEALRDMRAFLSAVDQPQQTRVYPVLSVAATELAQRLQPYLPAGAALEADPVGKRLLITAPSHVLDRADRLLQLLDRAQGLQTRTIPVHYAPADTVSEAIRGLLTIEVGSLWVDERSRQLIVSDFPEALDLVEDRVAALDQPLRQVLIEARIIQVSFDEQRKVGINWEAVEDDLNFAATFPILSDSDDGLRVTGGDLTSKDYDFLVEALDTFGETQLLSSPRIMVADGGTASIHVGSQVPYTTIDSRETAAGTIDRFEKVTIVNVGVKLDVVARIHGNDMVTLQIVPEVSSVTGFSGDIPVVETSRAQSTVTVQNETTVILGGLNRDEIRNSRSGIPILGSIPLLKYIFSSTDEQTVRTELAILLRPTIVTGREGLIETSPDWGER